MVKQLMAFIFMTQIASATHGQSPLQPARFRDFLFAEVSIQKKLSYHTSPPPGIASKYYQFDFYEPVGDTATIRPLIIWLHGGGFKFGTKKSGGLPLWSKTFARRGYVCAAINYRLSKKHPLKNFADMAEACSDAIEDVTAAIRFFKEHSRQFRVDSDRIILGGNSAGGIIALQAVYSSPAEMALLAHSDPAGRATTYNPEKVAAVINYWGALFNVHWLQNTRVPIVSVHGKKDRVVPYDNRKPPINGSLAINEMADSLGIPNELKIYERYAHELQKHFNPLFAGGAARKRWLEAGQFTADFLYRQLFQH